jgi:PIN domain nuclease of toxin-antitoxin system
MTLIDTHVLIWMDADDARLGRKARAALDRALRGQTLATSAISYWETAMLQSKRRVRIDPPLAVWRQDQLQAGLLEIAIDGGIGIQAAALAGFHGDPADRIIVASAIAHDAILVTADQEILGWKGPLKTMNALS